MYPFEGPELCTEKQNESKFKIFTLTPITLFSNEIVRLLHPAHIVKSLCTFISQKQTSDLRREERARVKILEPTTSPNAFKISSNEHSVVIPRPLHWRFCRTLHWLRQCHSTFPSLFQVEWEDITIFHSGCTLCQLRAPRDVEEEEGLHF